MTEHSNISSIDPTARQAALSTARELKLHRVLVPLDGRPAAEYAIPFAVMLAKWFKSELTLFHTLRPMHPARGGRPGQVRYPDALHDRGSSLASAYMEEVAYRLQPHDVRVRWGVATGDTAEMIATRSATGSFGLIAMTARQRKRVHRRFQPGVLGALWQLTAVPLLLVNERRVHINGFPVEEPRDIIVPYGVNSIAGDALPMATALAGASGARIRLLRATDKEEVEEPPQAAQDAPTEQELEQEEETPPAASGLPDDMEAVAEWLKKRGIESVIEIVRGDVTAAVAQRQTDLPRSWVVVASRMRAGISRSILGSVTDHVVRELSGPAVVVPAASTALRRHHRAHTVSQKPPDTP
ncbi:MAG: universal stress protein [Dehalococcoidia bacterium]